MAAVPSYKQWVKDTRPLSAPTRSEWWSKVDAALQAYDGSPNEGTKAKLKEALDRWRFEQSKQGKDWRKSARNHKGLVTELHRAVSSVDKRNLSPEELEAMKYIARAQAMALQKQFMGKHLQFKASSLVGMVQGAGSNWEKFKSGAGGTASGGLAASRLVSGAMGIAKAADAASLASARRAAASASSLASTNAMKTKVLEFLHKLCPDVDPQHVFDALHLGDLQQFAADVAPFVGMISSGGKALIGWAQVASQAYARSSMISSRYVIRGGDPEKAFDAIVVLLDRELASTVAGASRSTLAFTGQTLAAFADGGAISGPIIGTANALAGIFQSIYEYVRDYREVRTGNGLLDLGALNWDLFGACPILGCYFVAIQDHSTLINLAVADYGTENFVFDAERMIGKLQPIIVKAGAFIRASRFEIPGMSEMKGVVAMNYANKTGFDKVKGLPAHVSSSIEDKIDAWFEKPVKPPPVKPGRIVGFGSSW